MDFVFNNIGKFIVGFLAFVFLGLFFVINNDIESRREYRATHYCPEKMEMIRLHGGAIICATMPLEK